MSRARRSTVRVAGLTRRVIDVAVYEWGAGNDVIALMHGWQGRASQFATLVRELVFEGFRVVAFDAPAHGESPARGTYLVDWLDALRELQQRYGRFHTVIGHSFGGLAALVAPREGVATKRIATISAPADPDALIRGFQQAVHLDDRTAAALRRRFVRRYFDGDVEAMDRYSGVGHPLPAGTRLLVAHDEEDRRMPVAEASRILSAHPGAHELMTRGFGHARILASDPLLDAVLDLVTRPDLADEPVTEPVLESIALAHAR